MNKISNTGKFFIILGMMLVLYGTYNMPLPMYYGKITIIGSVLAIGTGIFYHKHGDD